MDQKPQLHGQSLSQTVQAATRWLKSLQANLSVTGTIRPWGAPANRRAWKDHPAVFSPAIQPHPAKPAIQRFPIMQEQSPQAKCDYAPNKDKTRL